MIDTYTAQIYMAGDIQQAKHVCREFCQTGLCVTIEPLDYIYTGGEESGFRVGLINYPRFPVSNGEIRNIAERLALTLRSRLFQHSYTIVFSDTTIWNSSRKESER